MLYTLIKAKSGLHAGATWRFDQGRITLGSSAKSDVFLCDPDIPDVLLSLQRKGRRYRIDHVDGEVRLSASDQRKIDDALFPAQVISLDFRHIQIELEVLTSSFSFASSIGDRFSQLGHSLIQLLRDVGARAICTMLLIMGLILTTAILFFGTAGVAKSQASTIPRPTELPRIKWKTPKPITVDQQMVTNAEQDIRDFALRTGVTQFSVQPSEGRLTMQAVLSRDQTVDFEKLVERLASDYGQTIQISAQIKMSPEQLTVDNLDIEQVVLGNRPAVILRDGHRLYLGGNYEGLTVAGINSQRIIFKGESATYEVTL